MAKSRKKTVRKKATPRKKATTRKRTEESPSAGQNVFANNIFIPPKDPPVHVHVPRHLEQRMDAIVSAASAVEHLAKAIGSDAVHVDISHCHFDTKDHPAITIKTEGA